MRNLADEIDQGIYTYGTVTNKFTGEKTFVYEADGFGNTIFMDDANIPSLLSLPYLDYVDKNDPLYVSTRKAVLSRQTNPYFFSGTAGQGTGGPHVGYGYVWPMSIMIRALTSDSDEEILKCLSMLKTSSAGTGFMHESFW